MPSSTHETTTAVTVALGSDSAEKDSKVAKLEDEKAGLERVDVNESPSRTLASQDQEKPTTHASERSMMKSITIVAACTGTMVLNVSSVTGISMAIPTIARELEMENDQIPWIVSAFALSSGCMLLLFGRLADLYGRKLVWLIGSLWIVVISIACSFAKTGVQLIVLRAMHGMGPAAMIPAALGILAHAFPPSRARSTAFATFSAGAPLGGAIGTVFGGMMAEYASYVAGCVYFTAALGAVVCVAGFLAIDRDPHTAKTDKRVDWIGQRFDGPASGWSSPLILSLLIGGVALIVCFLLWERYLINSTSFPPLMPLDIWTRAHGRFAAMLAVAFLEWACFTTLTLWAMLYYQNYQHLSPIQTMVRFLPMPVTGVICNVVVALTVGAINGAYLLALGTTATSLSALLFALINPSAPYWAFGFPAAVICVVGADFVFACGTLFIAKTAYQSEQSVAGALFQTVTALGTSLGLAITTIADSVGASAEARRMGVVLAHDATAAQIPPNVLLRGLRSAQFASFSFGICGLLVVVLFLHGIGIVGTRRTKAVVAPEEAGDVTGTKE
ncbi:SubName: Full=Related to aminotriazole resistance protein {ECO:0000313/EMBL:CCA74681.1} [Serendipita indica DSM 11827]|nr:SubName: Full=Related to aminotriazole resistance protein {ECO:0000313/EMBL:CCA74681.1} [Serendipita indica DSM 11827]